MLRVLNVLFFAFVLSFPANSKSNLPPASAANSQTKQLQQQISQLQTALKAAQDDRIDHENLIVQTKGLTDLENRVEDLGHYIALFGILITVIVIFFALRTSRESIAEAKQAADDSVKNWIAEQGDKIINPLEATLQRQGADILANIRQQGIETINSLKTKADHHHRRANEIEDELAALLDRATASLGQSGKALTSKDVTELQGRTALLRQKPEDQYSFDDWRTLYLEASSRMALDEVEKYVDGMKRRATDDWQNASAKTGWAWLFLNRQKYTEAEKLCDEIVDEYGASDDPRLLERVANALNNKSYLLIKQGQREAAIALYDDVASRYGAHTETDTVAQVAKALFGRACVLQQLNRTSEAKAAYSALIERYSSRTENEILEIIDKVKKNIRELNNA